MLENEEFVHPYPVLTEEEIERMTANLGIYRDKVVDSYVPIDNN